ncbi:MAG: matrixin family metalloprotease [Myxococcota bacterium]
MKNSTVATTAIIALALPTSAYAFNCTRVDGNGSGLYWNSRTLVYTFFQGGTSDLPETEEFDTVREGFAVWENLVTDVDDVCVPSIAATDFRWQENPIRSTVDRVGFNYIDEGNNENLVIFRDAFWPYPGQEDTVIALSTTSFNTVTGELLDADIEFNSANFQFTTRDFNPVTDLLNTAVHEIGHSMGIAHSPDRGASMFLQAVPGDTDKRTLNCDDRAAMFFKYPSGAPNGYCPPDAVDQACGNCAPPGTLTETAIATQTAAGSDVGGCSCHSGASSLWLSLLPLGWVLRLRRRVSLRSEDHRAR